MKKWLNILKNKYFIASIVFVVWVGILDSNNLIKTLGLRKELNELKKNKAYYLNEISESKRLKSEILNNAQTLEKFAREHYFMKKDDEDVFIISEDSIR